MKVICPYCKNEAKLITGKSLYPHLPRLKKLMFWRCDPCDAHVGTHGEQHKHRPLGILANNDLRKIRIAAHGAFDNRWKKSDNPRKQRSLEYKWLADQLGLDVRDCHIAMFDIPTCKKVIKLCKIKLA